MADIFDPVNLGSYDLRRKIMSFLSNRMPPYIALIRSQHTEFDTNTLPDPAYFDAYDPYTAKAYPAIGAYINGSDDYVMEDITFTGAQTFTTTYDVTIFVAARTAFLGTDDAGVQMWEQPERDSAMRIRDIYIAALKSILFNEPSLGTAGLDVGLAKVQRGTYSEILPDPMQTTASRFVATGLASVNIEHIESTSPEVYGYVHTFDTTVKLIDDTPDLSEVTEVPGEM